MSERDRVFSTFLEKKRVVGEEADPTTYSPLPISERKIIGKTDGYPYPIVQSGSSTYVELNSEKKRLAGEQAVALLFKGIVNVSDVVSGAGEYSGKYYSKIMPLEKIQERLEEEDVKGDLALMEAITGDDDRFVRKESWGHYVHNLQYDGNTVAYFDFAGRHNYEGLFDTEDSARFFDYAGCSTQTLERLIAKAHQLKDRVSGKDGLEFLRAIGQKINLKEYVGRLKTSYKLETPDDFAVILQTILLTKIETIMSGAQKATAKKESLAA
jgi:hypothetical protein